MGMDADPRERNLFGAIARILTWAGEEFACASSASS